MVGYDRTQVPAKRGRKKKPGGKKKTPKPNTPTPAATPDPSPSPSASASPSPSPTSTPGPCQGAEDAYNAAVAAQQETQRKLNDINSRKKEREVRATNDPKVIQKWQSDVDAATRANNNAVDKVNDTFKKRE